MQLFVAAAICNKDHNAAKVLDNFCRANKPMFRAHFSDDFSVHRLPIFRAHFSDVLALTDSLFGAGNDGYTDNQNTD